MMRLFHVLVGFCVAFGLAGSSCAESFHSYSNPRFGATAIVPSGWKQGPESANGDGRTFTSPDGLAQESVYGSYRFADTIAEEINVRATPQPGEVITYSKRGDHSIVVSGRKGDRIFYRKSVLSCHDSIWDSVALDYPSNQKTAFDPIVARVAASLHGDMDSCD